MLRYALKLIQSIHILGVIGGNLMAIEIITNNKTYNEKLIQMNNYCFNFLSKEDLEQYFGFLTHNDDATILGTIEEETLYASLMILNLSTYWNNQKIKVGGIGNVCSMPEWREKHAIAGLIKESLRLMKQNNQIFSLLGPFHYDFYRRYGWEWGEQKKIITMGIDDLKDFKSDGYRYSRLSYDNCKEMNDVYESYFSQYNGATVRDKNRWQLFLLMNEKEGSHIYGVYNEQNKLMWTRKP
ncbi:MAG: GNAT family N-acetyltransferase [Bacteroidales bacterium]|nr:GNAT family N-acetyltransferase [Bacteroidales bacterium]